MPGDYFPNAQNFAIHGGDFSSVQGGRYEVHNDNSHGGSTMNHIHSIDSRGATHNGDVVYNYGNHNETIQGNKIGRVTGGTINGIVNNGFSPLSSPRTGTVQGNVIDEVSDGNINGIVNNGFSPQNSPPRPPNPQSGYNGSNPRQGHYSTNQGNYENDAAYHSRSPPMQDYGHQRRPMQHPSPHPARAWTEPLLPSHQEHHPQLPPRPQVYSAPPTNNHLKVRPQPQSDVEDLAAKAFAKKIFPGYKLSGVITLLTLIKEASGAAPVGGLRSAAGCALELVRKVAEMKGNKVQIADIAQHIAKLSLMIIDICNRLEERQQNQLLHTTFTDHVGKFNETLKEVDVFIKKIEERSKFGRWVRSSADAADIERYRGKVADSISLFQLFMVTEMYTGLNQAIQSNVNERLTALEKFAQDFDNQYS